MAVLINVIQVHSELLQQISPKFLLYEGQSNVRAHRRSDILICFGTPVWQIKVSVSKIGCHGKVPWAITKRMQDLLSLPHAYVYQPWKIG